MGRNDVDGRRKLADTDRLEIHRRYFGRLRSGEIVEDIAKAFGITRKWVRQVALEVERDINPGNQASMPPHA